MSQSRRRFLTSLAAGSAVLAAAWPPVRLHAQDDPFGGVDPPNVFFSPCGKPFRAHPGAPYPVADWFKAADTNADGHIDKAEFLNDASAFFKVLDRNGDGVISPLEQAYYEQKIAPEVLGMRVEGTSGDWRVTRPALLRTQGMPGGMMGIDPGGEQAEQPDDSGPSKPYDASGKGAAPYGFFDEPEPVAAADLHFRGVISKDDFLRLATIHFEALDTDGRGYLTLDRLPRTPVQKRLERTAGRRRR